MPLDEIVDRSLQGWYIQGALQAQGERDVVGRAGSFKLMQEPQSALRERQRKGPDRLIVCHSFLVWH